jgi:hypothetical protein
VKTVTFSLDTFWWIVLYAFILFYGAGALWAFRTFAKQLIRDGELLSMWDASFYCEHPDIIFISLFWIVIPLEWGFGNFLDFLMGDK